MKNINNSKENNSSINEIRNSGTSTIRVNSLTQRGWPTDLDTSGTEDILKNINKNVEKHKEIIDADINILQFNRETELSASMKNNSDIQELNTNFVYPEQNTISNYELKQKMHEQIFPFQYNSQSSFPNSSFANTPYLTQPHMNIPNANLYQQLNSDNRQLYNKYEESLSSNSYEQNSHIASFTSLPPRYSQVNYKNTVDQTPVRQPKDALDQFDMNFDKITDKYLMSRDNLQEDIQIRQVLIRLIQKVADTHKVNFDHAHIAFCALMQAGGYLKSVTNRKITIGGVEFSKRTILYAMEETSCKYTLRSLSRYNRVVIAKVARKYNYPGHLYARFKIENPNLVANLPPDEQNYYARYCTDFQIENPDTPPLVREFLANREKTRNYSSKKNQKK